MTTATLEQTQLITVDANAISAKSYGINVEEVKAIVERYSLLHVNGPEDKNGLKEVRKARLELRSVRTKIDDRRKELKAGALEYGRRVDSVAKELTALVEPTELILCCREEEIANEIKRQATERLENRLKALREISADVPLAYVESIDDAEFSKLLALKTSEHVEKLRLEQVARDESERKAAEEAAAKAAEEARIAAEKKSEEDRLAAAREKLEAEQAAFRAEQEAARKKQEEQQAAIDAENARLAAERRKVEEAAAEQQRKAEAEARRIADAEQARKDAEERAERDRILAEEAAAAETAEAARREALKPDREKLLKFADKIEKLPLPDVSAEALPIRTAIADDLLNLARQVRLLVEAM